LDITTSSFQNIFKIFKLEDARKREGLSCRKKSPCAVEQDLVEYARISTFPAKIKLNI
jgi:hypothetical protein